VLDLVWKTLCLPPCDINLQPNQYGNQDENAGDIQFKTEPMEGGDQEDDDQDEPEDEAIEVEHEPEPGKPTKKASAAATTNLPLPIKNFQSVLARDSPRSIGSFESPRSPSGHGTPTAAGGTLLSSRVNSIAFLIVFYRSSASFSIEAASTTANLPAGAELAHEHAAGVQPDDADANGRPQPL